MSPLTTSIDLLEVLPTSIDLPELNGSNTLKIYISNRRKAIGEKLFQTFDLFVTLALSIPKCIQFICWSHNDNYYNDKSWTDGWTDNLKMPLPSSGRGI